MCVRGVDKSGMCVNIKVFLVCVQLVISHEMNPMNMSSKLSKIACGWAFWGLFYTVIVGTTLGVLCLLQVIYEGFVMRHMLLQGWAYIVSAIFRWRNYIW